VSLPYVDAVTSYLTLVVGLLTWRELSLGKLRLFLQSATLIALAIAVAGIALFLRTGVGNELMPYDNFLTTCTSTALVAIIAVPKLAHKFLATPDSKLLLVGTLFFATQALYTNVLGSLGHTAPAMWARRDSQFSCFRLVGSPCKWSLRTSDVCFRSKMPAKASSVKLQSLGGKYSP